MSKQRPIYFEKRYCLQVHSLVMHQKLALTCFSSFTGQREEVGGSCTYPINQIVYLNCIDVVVDGKTTPDLHPYITFYQMGDKKLPKSELGTVTFNMQYQRIVKPESPHMFSKDLENGQGQLHYKFVNLKTRSLSQEEAEMSREKKNQLAIQMGQDEYSERISELKSMLKDKDSLINHLEDKIEAVVLQNRRQSRNKSQIRESSITKDKHISLDVKVNSINEPIKRQNQRLMSTVSQLNEKLQQYEEQIEILTREKDTFEKEVKLLKKQNDKLTMAISNVHDQSNEMKQSKVIKRRSSIYVPNSMLSSNLLNTESPSGTRNDLRTSIVPPQEREVVFEQQPLQSTIRPRRHTSMMLGINVSPAPPKPILKAEKSMVQGSKTQIEPLPIVTDVPPAVEEERSVYMPTPPSGMELRARIQSQKEDYRLNNAIVEQNEEIEILNRKLQFKDNQVKALQKEIEKFKIAIKKKDAQIRQMKKHSRKNLMIGDSSRDVGSLRNRAEFEAQFDKMHAEHENEKLKLEQVVENYQEELEERVKELKKLRHTVEETGSRNKSLTDKFNQIKEAWQEATEQLIQYKERAEAYQNTLIKCQELEGALKMVDAKLAESEANYEELDKKHLKTMTRLKEMEREWDKLKRLERQHEFLSRQNQHMKASIESYEDRYNELKKYCIKIEAAYTKFVTIRKQANEAGRAAQEEESRKIQSQLIELNKKMNDVETSFFKQQLEDLHDEKGFVQNFYDEKFIEEKDKIMHSRGLSEREKEQAIYEKEKELKKGRQNKVQSINMRVSQLEKSLADVSMRSSEGRQSFIMSMPEKIKMLEKKLEQMVERENEWLEERKSLKETVYKANQELHKLRNSGSSGKLMVDKAQEIKRSMVLSALESENAKKRTLLEEARHRNEQSQQRNLEEHRRIATQYMKENSELRQKNQKLNSDLDKSERKANEREKQLEGQFKKSENEFKLKFNKLQERFEKLEVEYDHSKDRLAESQHAVKTLSAELESVSEDLDGKIETVHKLEDRITEFEERIEEYERSERAMMDEVADIKRHSEATQAELFALMETRSQNFSKIVKVKEVEIEKLNGVIAELELKLEAEMFEGIKLRETVEQQKGEIEEREKARQEKEEQFRLEITAKDEQCDQLYYKEFQAAQENQTLQSNLMEISTDIEQKEMEMAEMSLRLESMNQQVHVHEKQTRDYEGIEAELKEQIKALEDKVEAKAAQMRTFQEQMHKFQLEVEYSAKEMERVRLAGLASEDEAKQWQKKHYEKQEEIIQLKQDMAMLEIDIKKHEYNYEILAKEHDQYQAEIEELKEENTRMKDRVVEQSPSRSRVGRADTIKDPESPGLKATGRSRVVMVEPVSPGLSSSSRFPKKAVTLDAGNPQIINVLAVPQVAPSQPKQQTSFLAPQEGKKEEDAASMMLPSNLLGGENAESKSNMVLNAEETTLVVPRDSDLTRPPLVSNVMIDMPDPDDSLRTTNNYKRKQTISRPPPPEISQTNEQEVLSRVQFDQEREELLQKNQEYQELLQAKEKEVADLNGQIDELNQLVEELRGQLAEAPDVGRRSSRNISAKVSRTGTIKGNLEVPIRNEPIYDAEDVVSPGPSSHGQSRPGFAATEMQNQMATAELEIQSLMNEVHSLTAEVQEYQRNNEVLMEEADLCQQTMDDLKRQVEEAEVEKQHLQGYIAFEEMYLKEVELTKRLKQEIEQLTSQIFDKESKISSLMGETTSIAEELEAQRGLGASLDTDKARLQDHIAQLNTTIKKLKAEYRKYEEQSELEIMQLQERMDDLSLCEKAKGEELIIMGEQYLELEGEKEELIALVEQVKQQVNSQERAGSDWEAKFVKVSQQLQQTEGNRKGLLGKIKKLETEVLQGHDKVRTIVSEQGIMSKKYEIKLQGVRKELNQANERIAEKEKVIGVLKGEIALYNNECDQLKHTNDELTSSLNKVQKQLKDIMQLYQRQLEEGVSQVRSKEQSVEQMQAALKEKEKQYMALTRNLRHVEKEREELRTECLETRGIVQKLKQAKLRDTADLSMKLELKNNDYERVKAELERTVELVRNKENSHAAEIRSYDESSRGYKDRLAKYEAAIEEFEKDLLKFSQRPSCEEHEQVLFSNDVLRGRVEELEERIASWSAEKGKEEAVYAQFRKYKLNKDRQIADLEGEMEKYGGKINELEEALFVCKKENDELREAERDWLEEREDWRGEAQDLRDTLGEMEKQLDFYKKRKIFDMQKLLNETQ